MVICEGGVTHALSLNMYKPRPKNHMTTRFKTQTILLTTVESVQLLAHGYHEYLYKNAVKIVLINMYRYGALVGRQVIHVE